MQWCRRVRPVAHISLWATVIAAFLCVSVPQIFRGASKNTIHFVGPFHSSDSFLNFATGATNGSQRLITLFDSLPLSGSILILINGDDRRSSFLGMMTAYLAWPHPVRIVDLTRPDSQSELRGDDRRSLAAVAFCRVQRPPLWRQGERIGETLEIVPMGQAGK